MSLSFPLHANPNPAGDADVARVPADPGFGDHFTDHMVVATWTSDGGWQGDAVQPYGPFLMDPATAVLHYAQEIFEGMKAYRHADGSIHLFRPEANARRFQTSAARLMLPELPTEDFIRAVAALVAADSRWVPEATGERSLYIRPFLFASEVFLGVRAAQRVTFSVIASPAGPQGPSRRSAQATRMFLRAAGTLVSSLIIMIHRPLAGVMEASMQLKPGS